MNKNAKIIIASILLGSAFLGSTQTVFANSSEKTFTKGNDTMLSGTITPEDEDVYESEELTHSEVIELMQKKHNMSKEEALKIIGPDEVKLTKDGQLRGNVYTNVERTLTVTSTYKPRISLYTLMSEGGGYRGYKKVIHATLIRSSEGSNVSKQFSGELYYHLENPNKIYYMINGDFYNNGTTVVSLGASVDIGNSASTTFTVSSSSNHYKYFYTNGYFQLYK